jgi:hypothetical protein
VKKSYNIQELLHHKSKCHGTKPMHPSSKVFKREQECDLKHPSLVDLISMKQNKTNKQPYFIDRLSMQVTLKLLKFLGATIRFPKLRIFVLNI